MTHCSTVDDIQKLPVYSSLVNLDVSHYSKRGFNLSKVKTALPLETAILENSPAKTKNVVPKTGEGPMLHVTKSLGHPRRIGLGTKGCIALVTFQSPNCTPHHSILLTLYDILMNTGSYEERYQHKCYHTQNPFPNTFPCK